jgi:hypothetical protein
MRCKHREIYTDPSTHSSFWLPVARNKYTICVCVFQLNRRISTFQ